MEVVKEKPAKKTAADKRREAVSKAVMAAEAKFKALGVQYCVIAVDRDNNDPQGGTVFHQQDITGDDFINVLHVGLKTKEDLIAMGVQTAKLMKFREAELRDKLKPGGVNRAMRSAKNKYINKKGR